MLIFFLAKVPRMVSESSRELAENCREWILTFLTQSKICSNIKKTNKTYQNLETKCHNYDKKEKHKLCSVKVDVIAIHSDISFLMACVSDTKKVTSKT